MADQVESDVHPGTAKVRGSLNVAATYWWQSDSPIAMFMSRQTQLTHDGLLRIECSDVALAKAKANSVASGNISPPPPCKMEA